MQARQELAEYIKDHPELTWQEIAYSQNVSISQVNKVAKLFGLSKKI
jgi:DNA-binding MurR/RpiR family transcriptional regulator